MRLQLLHHLRRLIRLETVCLAQEVQIARTSTSVLRQRNSYYALTSKKEKYKIQKWGTYFFSQKNENRTHKD